MSQELRGPAPAGTTTVGTAGTQEGPDPSPRTAPGLLLRPIAIFAASRAAVLMTMWLTTRLTGRTWGEVFRAWDGNLYFQIISGGYPEFPSDRGIFAFFPLFPLSARALAGLPGIGPLGAGVLVSATAGLASAIGVWVLCQRLLGTATADRAVALFAFFPASFVLSMLYAEGVMIAVSAACLWALIRHRWLLAGILAAVATASRPNAIALIAACAWAAGAAVLVHRDWRSLVAPALAPLGIAAFFAMLWARTGDPTTWFTVQRELWKERVTPLALVDDIRVFAAAPFENTNTTVVVLGAVVSAVGLVLLVRSPLPTVLTVHAAVVIALAACSETLGPRPRFVFTAFPLFFVFALHLRGTVFTAVLAVSATLLGGFTLMSIGTILFTP